MKRFKQLFLALLFTACIIPAFSLNTQAAPMAQVNAGGSQIEPLSDVYEWRYTIIDEKLYRRLWNKTKGKWVGDWELCP